MNHEDLYNTYQIDKFLKQGKHRLTKDQIIDMMEAVERKAIDDLGDELMQAKSEQMQGARRIDYISLGNLVNILLKHGYNSPF